MDQPLSQLWMEFLVERERYPVCGLCGNKGWIDTRGTVFDALGYECGIRAPCICPDGRVVRERELEKKENG